MLFDEQARRELIDAAGAELRAMRAELEGESDLRAATLGDLLGDEERDGCCLEQPTEEVVI